MVAGSVRNREIAIIKIAVKQLGLDDACYRDMLWALCRCRSAADLDWQGRKVVIDHLKAAGAIISKNEWSFIDKATPSRRPLLRKICAVCRAMKVGKAYAEGAGRRILSLPPEVSVKLELLDENKLWLIAGALERTRKFGGPSKGEQA